MKLHYLTIPLIVAGTFQVQAQPAYRSVDEQGNVTFSDAPLPGAADETQININAPTPSPVEVEQSRKQADELLDAAGLTGTSGGSESGAAPDRAAQRSAAQRALQEAEQNLEATREVGPGDRIGTASGASRLTPQYLERVQQAEQKVERARQQLEAIK